MTQSKIAKVSVVIPCKNAADTLSNAITSAASQRDVDLQIICINDGSNDTSDKVLEHFAQQGLIEVLSNPQNQGAPFARNQGLAEATGDYVQFLDADDVLLSGKLYRQTQAMEAQQLDFIASAYRYHHFDGRLTSHYPNKDIWHGLLSSKLGRTSANLFRRQALIDIGGWDVAQKSSQEYQLMFRLLKSHARYGFDDEVAAQINATHGSISFTNEPANIARYIALRQAIAEYLQQQGLLTESLATLYHQVCRQMQALSGYST